MQRRQFLQLSATLPLLPLLPNKELNVVFARDNSGSYTKDHVAFTRDVIQSVKPLLPTNRKDAFIYHDTDYQFVNEDAFMSHAFGGATDPKPLFQYLIHNPPDSLFYFTDGELWADDLYEVAELVGKLLKTTKVAICQAFPWTFKNTLLDTLEIKHPNLHTAHATRNDKGGLCNFFLCPVYPFHNSDMVVQSTVKKLLGFE